MSHLIKMKNTGKVKTDATGIDCFKQAVEECKGTWIGKTRQRIYSKEVSGWHFKPVGYKFNVCIQDTGKARGDIVFDDFNGKWGDKKELDKIYQLYKGKVAVKAAEELGFNVESATLDKNKNYVIVMGK